jgi:hypothetical protein
VEKFELGRIFEDLMKIFGAVVQKSLTNTGKFSKFPQFFSKISYKIKKNPNLVPRHPL